MLELVLGLGLGSGLKLRLDQFDAWIVTRLLAAFGPTDGI
jgi:hypothetical protein